MNIPKTTKEFPYIEFRFYKDGKMTLSTSNGWWGGKNASFISSGGYEGNTCLPKDLDAYIKAFKARKIKSIEKEILILKKKLNLFIK